MDEKSRNVEDQKRKLPIGIEDFETIIKGGYCYVDKTGLIADLLGSGGLVTLFTRPRRFGKSLNMSMLKAFFSPESDKSVFEGLKISKEAELCRDYMGQYPVIALSLKDICAENYETAYEITSDLIREAAAHVDKSLSGVVMHGADRAVLDRLLERRIPESALYGSLYHMSRLLEEYLGRKVVILIDEYDVPLAKAHEQGYYDQMVMLIRNLFQQALKTNTSLKLAVLTGCMRVSKESIFTGLNNLKVLGVADARLDEYFGFTDREVRELLVYYGLSDRYEEVREWYDGYRFGNVNVYCPWDVINYCDCARYDSSAFPENYWINSSGNAVVRRFIECSSNAGIRDEIEELVNGGEVEKRIRQDLTYPEMYASVENIWSVLFTTGYLTQKERLDGNRFRLVIPNREIRSIYTDQLLELFREDVRRDGETLGRICDALLQKDTAEAQRCLESYLRRTISIRDTAVRRSLSENFYHGILLGILSVKEDWGVSSNQEAGDGYSDIIVRTDNYELAMILEVKYADDGRMDAVCTRALRQIEEKNYTEKLLDDGYEYILKYGVAFYKKRCRIMLQEDV